MKRNTNQGLWLLAVVAGLLACTTLRAQVRMQKAVIVPAAGISTNGTETMQYTLGQVVTGAATNGTYAGTFGFWNATQQVSSVDNIAELTVSVSVAPNPISADGADVRIEVKRAGMLNVELFDEVGKKVRDLYSGEQEPGIIIIQLATNGLPSGAYYIAATVPGGLLQIPVSIIQ